MNVAGVKALLFILDQIAAWTIAAQRAAANPNMTQAEAGQLIAETKARAEQISEAWRNGKK